MVGILDADADGYIGAADAAQFTRRSARFIGRMASFQRLSNAYGVALMTACPNNFGKRVINETHDSRGEIANSVCLLEGAERRKLLQAPQAGNDGDGDHPKEGNEEDERYHS
jgi:hypothetical protein